MPHISDSPNIDKLAIITVVYQNYEVLKDFFSSFNNQTNKNQSILSIFPFPFSSFQIRAMHTE